MNKNKLFIDNEKYIVKKFKNKKEWRNARQEGIGGSDVAAILGLSPFKDINELYKEKVEPLGEDIKSPLMEYGTKCEEYIRKIFKLDHPDYTIYYKKDITLKDKERPFISYSPDGIIYDKTNKKWGILEIKTTTINQHQNWDSWDGQIPNYYYAQILQGLLVTGFDFVVLTAHINIRDYLQKNNETKVVREYYISRENCEDDIKYLKEKEIEFWEENVMKRKEPPKKFQI